MTSKYGNKKATYKDMTFASVGERDRYIVLEQEQRDGLITGLQRQVPFNLTIGDMHICKYIADFVYTRAGRGVVEDYKGMRTDVFNLKAKMFRACYGFDILITGKQKKGNRYGLRTKR